MARINVLNVFPELSQGWHDRYNYEPMVDAFGRRILVRCDDDDYQGDSYRLIADGDEPGQRYGVLIFGWGSCSGCDALQSCCSLKELQELMDSLQDSIKWFESKEELRTYMIQHDWEGDWSYSSKKSHVYRDQVKEFLDSENV